MKLALKLLSFALAGYLAVFALMFLAQRKLMYFPDTARTAPATAGLTDVEEVTLATPDGVRLIAWHARAAPGRLTLLYFHGNGGSLAARTPRFKRFMAEGLGVFMLTWRGYGGSTGSPSETANVADAYVAYAALLARGVAPERIVAYGESLGTGVAVQLAAQKPVAALILDAPFTSAVDVAAAAYPFLPVRLAMLDRYESIAHIGRVRVPVLVMHGEKDRVIPAKLGRALYAAANEPKELVVMPLGGHSDLYFHGALEAVRSFLRDLPRLRSEAAPSAPGKS
jgi:hypothetical protein